VITQILVALDGSPRAPGVFNAAAEVASRFGATIHPFRAVVVPPEFPAAGAGSSLVRLSEYLLKSAVSDLLRVAKPSRGVEVSVPLVRVGQPWRLIVQASDELDVDLIVLGSHGYGPPDRVLGTTAAHVANCSTRNVLVVHGPASFERSVAAGPSARDEGSS
jgi:nucleotide-binding universal stress UspA family protein